MVDLPSGRSCLTCGRQTCDRQPEGRDPDDCKDWKARRRPGTGKIAWLVPRNKSSSKYHAYRGGKAICGSPLELGTISSDTRPPLVVGCKKCLAMTEEAV